MANVMFKRGLQANLPKTGIVDGAFYLTTDTNRLYVGQGNALVELNKSITAVAKYADLPSSNIAIGQFYYLTDENILCYYNGTRWVQINPDTALEVATDALSVSAVTGGAKVGVEVVDTKGNAAAGEFTIVGSDAVTVSGTDRKVTVSAHDTKSAVASKEVTVKVNDADVTGAAVVLKEDNVESSAVNFVGGKNVTVTRNGDGTVVVSASDAADMTNSDAVAAFDAAGMLSISVEDAGGTVTAEVTPEIEYADGQKAVFANGVAKLEVYSKEQVNNLLATADALVFRGAVDALPAITTAQNGDTYKLTKDITAPVAAKIGDLVIAHGTEDTNGKLTAAGEWIVIPAGDDQVITGEVDATAVSMVIEDQSGVLAGLDLDAGEAIAISATESPAGVLKATVAHGAPLAANTTVAGSTADVAQTAAANAEFTAVTELKYDKFGHVVGASAKKFTVVDTHNHLSDVAFATTGGAETIGADVTATLTVEMDDETDSTALTFGSESLRLMQNNGAIDIDLIWGSF